MQAGNLQLPNMEGVKNVLLDIEGTICPISFVKDTLVSSRSNLSLALQTYALMLFCDVSFES
jgi:hypothetical protein